MLDERTFLQVIGNDPDDDGPRLQYADWLDEKGDAASVAKAEFIRVQCALESMGSDDPARMILRSREMALLEANWRTWLRPACQALGEPLPLGPGRRTGAAADRYRIRWLQPPCHQSHLIEQVWSDDGNVPYFHSCQFRRGVLSHAVLVSKPYRSKLNVIRFWDRELADGLMLGGFEAIDVQETLAAIEAERLRSLELHFTGDEVLDFASKLPRLRSLRELVLRGLHGDAEIGKSLAEKIDFDRLRVLEVYSSRFEDSGLLLLSLRKVAEHVERLVIVGCELTDNSARFLSLGPDLFPNLRHVDFTENHISSGGMASLRQRFGKGAITQPSEHPWPSRFFQ